MRGKLCGSMLLLFGASGPAVILARAERRPRRRDGRDEDIPAQRRAPASCSRSWR